MNIAVNQLINEELKNFDDCQLTLGSKMDNHREIFLFARCTRGTILFDILTLKWNNFDKTHIHFTINKKNNKESITLSSKTRDILSKYNHEGKKESYIYPLLRECKGANNPRDIDSARSQVIEYLNENLKTIAKTVFVKKDFG